MFLLGEGAGRGRNDWWNGCSTNEEEGKVDLHDCVFFVLFAFLIMFDLQLQLGRERWNGESEK